MQRDNSANLAIPPSLTSSCHYLFMFILSCFLIQRLNDVTWPETMVMTLMPPPPPLLPWFNPLFLYSNPKPYYTRQFYSSRCFRCNPILDIDRHFLLSGFRTGHYTKKKTPLSLTFMLFRVVYLFRLFVLLSFFSFYVVHTTVLCWYVFIFQRPQRFY